MQPFARPVTRLVWGHARLGLDRAAWQGKTAAFGPKRPGTQSSAICLRCSIRAIETPGRSYSTQIPPRHPDSTAGSKGDKGAEAGNEPESIDQPRAEPINTTDVKSQQIQPDGAKADQSGPDLPKSRNIILEDKQSPRDLPSWAESRRTQLTQKFSEIMDKFQTRALHATQTLNDVTGYSSIEHIKRQNAKLEELLADAHERVRTARQAYKTSNTKRATTQREVTTLLARKDSWSPLDLERFTDLYRVDHILESEVVSSQEALTEAEADEQSLNQQLNAGILKRYHEEQIWSDRIRRASTWGTWGLMGMNFLLFVILQFVAEPWKRRRLVRGVVAEEKAVLEEVRNQLEEVKLALKKRGQTAAMEPMTEAVKVVEEAQAQAIEETAKLGVSPVVTELAVEPLAEIAAETPVEVHESSGASWQQEVMQKVMQKVTQKVKEVGIDHHKWGALAADLYSERRIDLRMRDASLLALQGALAGAALTGSIALLFVRRS
ncbi:Mdm33 family-domain-containing protein [Thelonectria olida]|uniref:Sensitive to high expression protein 9, mitochondrial n=1 Tax=Thelonectria olida TaxID=1576542 RepID=A0A9P8WAN8_9HYPO|nr:Mdm33 family-domain-containing protein [Thelonectria olida]